MQVDYPTFETNIKSTFRQARIRIIDQGFGITEKLQQHIFEKYTIGDLVKGTPQIGLGLAFCKLVVDVHDGTIGSEKNHPQGSIFTIEI